MNGQWIKADVKFNEGRAILTLGMMHMAMYRDVCGLLGFSKTPEEVEKSIRDIIEKFRPELKDCTIHYIGYAISTNGFEIGVYHPSLPACSMYDQSPRIPLIPDPEKK